MFPMGSLSQQTSGPVWTKVLDLKFNGSNGSTTFTDSTGRHTPSFSGSAAISTAKSVEGGSSLYLNQNGFVRSDGSGVGSSDFNFTGADFRIIADIWPTSANSDYAWIKTSSDGQFGMCFRLYSDNGINTTIWISDKNASNILTATVPSLLNKWSNIELKREGDLFTLLINGSVISTSIYTLSNIDGVNLSGFQVSAVYGSGRYSGWIDNFTVYKK